MCQAIYTANDASKRILPDTAFHYGGAQWQLAGGLAEAIAGKPWAELIRETYAEPCGAPSLGYTNQFSLGGPGGAFLYPPSFQGDAANLPSTDNPSVEGGIFVTAPDYGKLLLMHLRDGMCDGGRVLSAAAAERMRSDRIAQVYGPRKYGGDDWAHHRRDRVRGLRPRLVDDRGHAGVFADPGLYGAFPWLDLHRNYGAFIAIEEIAERWAESSTLSSSRSWMPRSMLHFEARRNTAAPDSGSAEVGRDPRVHVCRPPSSSAHDA